MQFFLNFGYRHCWRLVLVSFLLAACYRFFGPDEVPSAGILALILAPCLWGTGARFWRAVNRQTFLPHVRKIAALIPPERLGASVRVPLSGVHLNAVGLPWDSRPRVLYRTEIDPSLSETLVRYYYLNHLTGEVDQYSKVVPVTRTGSASFEVDASHSAGLRHLRGMLWSGISGLNRVHPREMDDLVMEIEAAYSQD